MLKMKNRIAVGLVYFVALAALTLYQSNSLIAQPPTADTPSSWLRDAELTDVFFLNESVGWAVGEHGSVLKTANGGESWTNTANLQRITDRDLNLDGQMQRVLNTLNDNLGQQSGPQSRLVPTGINFRFESIHFCDAKNGIVVGGYDVPYLDRSRAVVMRTDDGGSSWKVIKGLVIPRLAKVHMDNEASVWAVGDSSNLNRSGIYQSSDGGYSWLNQSGKLLGSYRDAARTGQSTVVVNSQGKLIVIRGQQAEHSVVLGNDEPMPISRVRMFDATTGWAVGYSGQILQTRNGGLSWKQYPKQLPNIDFQAMTIANGKLWCAGNPGTYVISIDLQTGTHELHRTPVTTAINSITFSSPKHGWAVGDCGNILATVDGGRSWQLQRSAYRRVALMTVSFDLTSTALPSLAQYAGENNAASASVHLVVDKNQLSFDAIGRVKQATSRIGCNVCRFYFPKSSDGNREYLRELTLAIRTHQPNLLICESPVIRHPDGLVDPQNLLQQAIEAAADRNVFSDQLVELGLSPWQVDRLAVYDAIGQGDWKLNTDRFLPSVGRTIEDYTAISEAILGLPISQSGEKTFRVKQYGIVRNFRGADLLDGLRQLSRTVPSRSNEADRRSNLHQLQHNVSKIADLKALGEWRDLDPNSLLEWRRRLNSIVVGQDNDLAGVWLCRLATEYMRSGQWQMAAITLNQMTARYENHPLAPAAMLWLAQYHASDEMLVDRIRPAQAPVQDAEMMEMDSIEQELMSQVTPASFQSQAHTYQQNGMNLMIWVPDQIKKEVDEERASQGLAPPEIDPVTEAYRQASSIVTKIRSRDPDLGKDRYVRFLEAKLTNRVQRNLAAENLYQQLVTNSAEGDSIFTAGGREIKLSKPNAASVEGLICTRLESRPNLDGDLNEPCWNAAMTNGEAAFLRMTPPGRNVTPKTDLVVFAHDDEFLYIAARCNKLSDYPYRNTNVARERDADLNNRDRIEFAFDTDRDYQTYLQFAIDHRGWCHDSATGSSGWNPEWFIAQDEDEKSWSIEIAIPLTQLTSRNPASKTVWAVSAARKMGRYPGSLWPARNLDFQAQQVGLHRVARLFANEFELFKFTGDPSEGDVESK